MFFFLLIRVEFWRKRPSKSCCVTVCIVTIMSRMVFSSVFGRLSFYYSGHIIYALAIYSKTSTLVHQKLQSKCEKSKTEHVKEKGLDKEKRKVRKHKEEKQYEFSDGKLRRLKINDKCHQEKKFKDGFSERCVEEKAESLDNSGLTEEHDEPMCVYLSDGNQSRKRKIDSTPSNGITVNKNILRIRLPTQKQRESDALPSKELSCSTAGKVSESQDQQTETVHVRGKKQQQCSTNSINGELPPPKSDLGRKEKVEPSGAKTAFEIEMQRTESLYQSLLGDLVSIPLVPQMDTSEDLEWLLGTKKQRGASKTLKASDDVSCRQSSSMWLHAQYLPEVDIYSLPYTIPF
ncbi:hypothetical protein Ddye_007294 [Dipteronia dyeriana]|uniref:Uncharacterized protein n=1 Tax=Dipteronia dyeriana TaxID=168575 RepID=A0AAE0CRI7_9ROSI|nr:hypothetical protein Ddye_007294 [Dipteronia dyeriana]